MRIGLQVGFGTPVGVELLRELRGFGFDMVRISANTDAPTFAGVPAEQLAALVQEVIDAELAPLVIVRAAGQIPQIPAGIDVEMGNEPDMAINGWREGNAGNASLPSYVDEAMRAIDAAADRNPLWIGCPRGLHSAGFRLLRLLPWSRIPSWVGCSVHRYPVGNLGPNRSPNRSVFGVLNKNFGREWSREDEVKELKRIIGDRPFGVSELGYNRLDYPSDDQLAANLTWERSFWERQGANFAVAYQINDGDVSSQKIDDHFGFRRADGEWRRCKDAWCGTAARNT